ncbi:MAG TPA: hypothetical protein VFS08_04930, partial [Gemmatimonadaceae bacterium]|nr:hypothetical protein [Gemmatimonadaceae bacterium]
GAGAALCLAHDGDDLLVAEPTLPHRILPQSGRVRTHNAPPSGRGKGQLLPLMTREAWEQIIALQVTRDSLLEALLTNDADRAKFAKRAAKMMPKPPPAP